MPIKKSGIKELRKAQKRAVFNASRKRNIKEALKKIHKALAASKVEEAQTIAKKVVTMLDKAAKINLIHKNMAARKKSRMFKAIKKAASK